MNFELIYFNIHLFDIKNMTFKNFKKNYSINNINYFRQLFFFIEFFFQNFFSKFGHS